MMHYHYIIWDIYGFSFRAPIKRIDKTLLNAWKDINEYLFHYKTK
jgi:hypothetical protein